MTREPISKDDILHLFGALSDHAIVEIIQTGADYGTLSEAATYLEQADDVMGDLRKPLSGKAAIVYDIVVKEQGLYDEE